jgi:hypothetical protein
LIVAGPRGSERTIPGVFEGVMMNALKIVGLAALMITGSGGWPNRRYGGAIAIGVCIIAAVVLHFAAP